MKHRTKVLQEAEAKFVSEHTETERANLELVRRQQNRELKAKGKEKIPVLDTVMSEMGTKELRKLAEPSSS